MAEDARINRISPRTFELLGMDTIESQFPILFKGGNEFPVLTAYCAQCNQPIESQHLRGEVSRSQDDVYTLEAAGACMRCHVATPVFYRLHADGTMTGVSPEAEMRERRERRGGFLRGLLGRLSQGRLA